MIKHSNPSESQKLPKATNTYLWEGKYCAAFRLGPFLAFSGSGSGVLLWSSRIHQLSPLVFPGEDVCQLTATDPVLIWGSML